MSEQRIIVGKKKGASGGFTGVQDTMRSVAFARVLDAVSEGEIEGLVDGAKSIYLDGTKLQSDAGTFNFENVQVDVRNGTAGQSHIEGFPSVENEVNVGVQVKKATPVTRTITNANVDAVRVKIQIPSLAKQDSKSGAPVSNTVKFAIEVQSGGTGAFVRKVEDEITGQIRSRYERSYRIGLEGNAPWAIRMVRISEDETSSSAASDTYFSSMTEIIEAKLSYPNTALIGLRIDASQFSSIPTRSYHMKLLRIKVPSNYNPVAHTYSGNWDGTFKIAWSNNPAWCFYDMLTSKRYGLGGHVSEELVDKWGLYTIGKYCDEMVPDGRGGQEPRFTLNCYLQQREDSYKVLNDLASCFRGMIYWANGSVVATQDTPQEPSYVFTDANVVNGEFTYTGSSAKTRHSVALVSWNDLTDMGRQKVEYVEDTDGIEKYGVIETEVTAFGCTSQAQAHRVGRWILASELTETETVTFKSGIEGVSLYPGMVIRVRDNFRNGQRLGGRMKSISGTSMTLDAPVTLPGAAKIHILKPDGTVHTTTVAQTSTEGVVRLGSAPVPSPVAGATWVITAAAGTASESLYRIVSVSEGDKGTHEVSALAYNADKFNMIDTGVWHHGPRPGDGIIINPPVNPNGLAAPTGIKAVVSNYVEGSLQKFRISLSWTHVDGLTGWEVEWKKDKEQPVVVSGITTATFDINDASVGSYYSFRVRAVGMNGQVSGWAVGPSVYVGVQNINPDNIFLNAQAQGGFLQNIIRWTYADTPAAKALKSVYIYGHVQRDDGTNKPVKLGSVAYPATMWVHPEREPGEEWRYYICGVDQAGNESSLYPPNGLLAAANVDVTHILDALHDSFVESQFYKDLIGKIDAIEIPGIDDIRDLLDGIGDIYDRVEAIRKDLDRSGELILRNVVAQEEYKRATGDAFARVRETIDIIEDGLALEVVRRQMVEVQVQNTNSLIAQEQVARADGDSALASQLDILQATVISGDLENKALILQEQTARADQNTALATTLNALAARINSVGGSGKTIEAIITEERAARVSADAATASIVTGIVSRFDNFGTGGSGNPNSVEARFAEEQSTRATADSANTTAITQVSARINNINGVTMEQKFQVNADSINGLSGQYTIKIDNNGHVSGFGLASVPVNGATVSTFAVAADRFVIASPSTGNITPFQVLTTPQMVNGILVQPGVYIQDAYIKNGFITEAKIGDLSVSTLKIRGEAVSKIRQFNHATSAAPTSAQERVTVFNGTFNVPSGTGGARIVAMLNMGCYPSTSNEVAIIVRVFINGQQAVMLGQTVGAYVVSYAMSGSVDSVPDGDIPFSITIEQQAPWTASTKPMSLSPISLTLFGSLR